MVKIVCAVKDIPSGNLIQKDDIAELVVARNKLPIDVVSDKESYKEGCVHDFFVESKEDAISRVAVIGGIRKGQIIVHRQKTYWGLTGANFRRPQIQKQNLQNKFKYNKDKASKRN